MRHRGRLTARDHQGRDECEICGSLNANNVRAAATQRSEVLANVALEG
jgi:hypothetical protein